MVMLFGIFLLNFAISWFNAWSCGKSWLETKESSGFLHFMNWCGAIMSAVGFTWCMLLLVTLGLQEVHPKWWRPEYAKGVFDLGYLVIILPCLGSGLAITLHSWAYTWRNRTFGNVAITGWNSFAQIYNTVRAIEAIPEALKGVTSLFSLKGDSKNNGVVIVIGVVILCLMSGILLTTVILRSSMKNHGFAMAAKYPQKDRYRRDKYDIDFHSDDNNPLAGKPGSQYKTRRPKYC